MGPPPTPILAEPYAIRLVEPDADADMVSEWINRPHLAQAWEYDWPSWRWRRYLGPNSTARTRAHSSVVSAARTTVMSNFRAAKDSIATRYAADPHDVGLHAAIADPKIVNRGFGPILLPRIVASVFAQEARCRRIMFDPDHRNIGARRLCEYAGCTFLGEHNMANRRMALYASPRSPADVPDIG